MQMHGATKTELDLLTLLRESEAEPASFESTNKSVALSNAIEELQRLRGSGNQTLPIDELADRFYTVRGQRDQLIATIQKIQAKHYDVQRIIHEAATFVLDIKPVSEQPK